MGCTWAPVIPAGVIATRGGADLASGDTFQILVRGDGGHASAPHDCLDPIPIACEIVQAFQTLVTRRVNAFDPAVVTVAKIEAGTTRNIIPETASLLGTIRTVSEKTRDNVLEGVKRVAEGVAAAHGAKVEVNLIRGYPGHRQPRRLRRASSAWPPSCSAPSTCRPWPRRSWAARTSPTSCSA